GAERAILSIVADQSGGPTPARDIAQALLHMASRMLTAETTRGIYHFAGTPDVSWADFAREIFSHAGLTCEVRDIATADYPTPARRPLNSRLNCRKIERDFGISRPDWRVGLQDVLRQLKETA
ncbi:MAG: sugar nucleotide-binding protein, partial [Paracoccus sp. (in: a-proteobacteria)]